MANEFDGARGGDAEGNPPPRGGKGGADGATDPGPYAGEDGDGAIASIDEVIAAGTTIKGGGSKGAISGTTDFTPAENGEIQITFKPIEPVQSVSKRIKGANVELNWNNSDIGELEVQRSTDGFQTVETVDSGLPGNTSSFVDRGAQRSQQVKYRVVKQEGNETAESAPVQAELPKFEEVPNPELGNSNKPRFSNIGVPSSASSIKVYKANGVQPVFPDDYTLVEESANGIDEFNDDAASNDSYISYAFTTVDGNGNESNPDIRQAFVPPKDAAVLRDDNNQ